MNDIPATIDLNPVGNQPEGSIIWLHGLGADGNDFVPIVERFHLLAPYKLRFVFPHAPVRAVTVNAGMQMRAWYDILELSNLSQKEDVEGLKASERAIRLLIEREQKLGIEPNRIVLAGFSQGGAIALYTALRFPRPLAGVVALSAYLPVPQVFSNERDPANQSTPIFMAHGIFDPIVPVMLGQMSKAQLEKLAYTVDWHSYPMEHTVTPEEIEEIEKFLYKVLFNSQRKV